MGHDRRHFPVALQGGQHVLHEHQVSLLSLFRHKYMKTAGELDLFLNVVLTERRICQDTIIALQFVVVLFVLGLRIVSSWRISAWPMPWRSMFILQIDQVVPIFSCP